MLQTEYTLNSYSTRRGKKRGKKEFLKALSDSYEVYCQNLANYACTWTVLGITLAFDNGRFSRPLLT